MIYFISGHRDITQEEFDANYVPAIEDAIDNGQTTWEDSIIEESIGDEIVLTLENGFSREVTFYERN
jgi:hypothetical protein